MLLGKNFGLTPHNPLGKFMMFMMFMLVAPKALLRCRVSSV
jgi:cytochrome b